MRFDVDTQASRERPDKIAAPAYKSITERDADLWGMCRLSGAMLEIADVDADSESVAVIIAANRAEIAELFYAERDYYPRDLEQALREFEARHFGHQLVPMPHGLLMRAVLDSRSDVAALRGYEPAEVRQRWRMAVRNAGGQPAPKSDSEAWVLGVIREATGEAPKRVAVDWPGEEA